MTLPITLFPNMLWGILAGIFALLNFTTHHREFGPTIPDPVQVEILDRNNNNTPDTLKFTFEVHSEEKIIGFGGTEICLANERGRLVNCQNVSYNYEIPCSDGVGHDILKKGITTCIKYLYIIEPKDFSVSSIRIKTIGDNPIIMQRFKNIDSLNLQIFESLPFGKIEENYPSHVQLDTALE